MQAEDFGKNADEEINREYCRYCWSDGKFNKDKTMEE